eukprot:4099453-Pyramimonas_sp.AAC.1
MGISSFPFRNWCTQWVYSLSPSTIGAHDGYILSPLPRLVPAPHLQGEVLPVQGVFGGGVVVELLHDVAHSAVRHRELVLAVVQVRHLPRVVVGLANVLVATAPDGDRDGRQRACAPKKRGSARQLGP